MHRVMEHSKVDFGIACGHRSVKEQQELYAQGRTVPGNIVTNVDGVKTKSKHNSMPSIAVDIYAFVNGSASWDEKYLVYLGGMIEAIAADMYARKEISHKLRWGGNWNGDGVIITDQRLIDLPHFELIQP